MRKILVFLLVIFSLDLSASTLTIGIISAVPGEIGSLIELIETPVSTVKGMRTYTQGKLQGIDTVVALSRVGKVAAAATAVHLIVEYNVDMIIFTGVAGAVDDSLNVGDIVVANSLIQHDMDARPFRQIYEIPFLNITTIKPDPHLEQLALKASTKFIHEIEDLIPKSLLNEFNIIRPKVLHGLIITGDHIVFQEKQKALLKKNLPDALCVEMEGASVGQVCYEYGIPFIIVRTISDYSNNLHFHVDVKKFVHEVAGLYSVPIINNLYTLIRDDRN